MKKVRLITLPLLCVFALARGVYAADNGTELYLEDDFTALGTAGTALDPDTEIKGFTVFGSTQAAYTGAVVGPGNVVVNGVLSVSSGAYFVENSTFTGAGKIFINDGSAGQLLRKDGSGSLIWVSPSLLGDGLGDHIATTTLNMGGFNIVGVSTITVSSITTTAARVFFSTNVTSSGLISAETLSVWPPGGLGSVSLRNADPGNSKIEVHIRPNSGKEGWLSFTENTFADKWIMGIRPGDSKLYFATGSPIANTSRVVMEGNGNVGIGTASPGAKLDVAGVIRSSSSIYPGDGFNFQSSRFISDEPGNYRTVFSSNVYLVGYSSASKYYGDGSGLTGIPGDNLGGHVATMTLTADFGVKSSTAINAGYYQINGSTVLAILPGAGSLGIGVDAGRKSTGNSNTFVGSNAGGSNNAIGSENVFVGYGAGNQNIWGGNNTFLGSFAGPNNSAGNNNSVMGNRAYWSAVNGYANSIFGAEAGYGAGGSFSSSTLMGYQAGYNMLAGSADNIFVGYKAGYNVNTGSGNIVIGYAAGATNGAAVKELNIGGVLYGDLAVRTIGIATPFPQAALDIVSTGTASDVYAQIWRNSGGVIIASVSSMGIMSASTFNAVGSAYLMNGVVVIDSYRNIYAKTMAVENSMAVAALTISGNEFSVGGSTLVVKAGNVGVGTADPAARFEVSGGSVVLHGLDSQLSVFQAGDNGLIISTGGAIQTTGKGYGAVAGTIRGLGAVDLQTLRSVSGQAASAPYSMIGGGAYNTASGFYSGVSAGNYNTASNGSAFAGGGSNNTAGGYMSSILGGDSNNTGILADYAAVAGGQNNSVSAPRSFIGGGAYNIVSGSSSVVSGGAYNVVNGTWAVISGGMNNTTSGEYSIVSGGYQNTAMQVHSAVAGGWYNNALGPDSFIGGGGFHTVDSQYGTVAGGATNKIRQGAYAAFIGGGENNISTGSYSMIGGGRLNVSSGSYSTIGGGNLNESSGTYASVLGGNDNTAGGDYASIGGGNYNKADGIGAVVGGGQSNIAGGSYNSTVAGGSLNKAAADRASVGGGESNTASGEGSTVAGGSNNKASGGKSAIPGGYQNSADGQYSFAAGFRSTSAANGAFTWKDSQADSVINDIANQVRFRAGGGFWVSTSAVYSEPGLFVNSENRVGVGTIAPSARLEVFERNTGSNLYALKVGTASNSAILAVSTYGAVFVSGALNARVWQRIFSVDLAANMNSFSIPNLRGNADEEYKLLIRLKEGAVGNCTVQLQPNGDAAAANYNSQFYGATGAAAVNHVVNAGTLGYIPIAAVGTGALTEAGALIEGTLYAKGPDPRVYSGTMVSITQQTTRQVGAGWNGAAAEINSLVINTDIANCLGAGTHIELWAFR